MSHPLRVYAPLTQADLLALRDDGAIELRRPVHAATDRVRRAFPEDDEEDLEYAALWDAAEALTAGSPQGPVLVAAADVPTAWLTATAPGDGDDPEAAYLLDLDRPLPRSSVVSLHVAAPDAGPDDELLWHDISELGALVEAGGSVS